MAILGRAYIYLAAPGDLVEAGKFYELFKHSHLKDEDFNTENYKPGNSGQTKLRIDLEEDFRLEAKAEPLK
jgi:hypothetical protein